MRSLLILPVLAALLAGCAVQSHRPLAENTFIVLMEIPPGEAVLPGSMSAKAYRSASARWNLPVALNNEVRSLIDDYGLEVVSIWPLMPIRELCVVIRSDDSEVDRLRDDRRVASVQAVHYFDVMGGIAYNDPEFQLQYGDRTEEVARLHAWSTGEDVRVAIVDTPVATDHEDLLGQIESQVLFVREHLDDKDLLHGTGVAGTIVARPNNGIGVVGLAPDVTLGSYAACYYRDAWRRTVCDTFALAKALAAVYEDKADVVNLSLAGPDDVLLARLVERLIDRGAIVIAAENPGDPEKRFPASLEHVIAVTTPGSSSSVSPPAVRSPDEQLSTKPGNGYQFFYGTSISAAKVTALAALLVARERLGSRDLYRMLTTLHDRCVSELLEGPECSMSFALAGSTPRISAAL